MVPTAKNRIEILRAALAGWDRGQILLVHGNYIDGKVWASLKPQTKFILTLTLSFSAEPSPAYLESKRKNLP